MVHPSAKHCVQPSECGLPRIWPRLPSRQLQLRTRRRRPPRNSSRSRPKRQRLPGRRPTPRESPELHTVAVHTALGPVACPLPHRSLPCPTAACACGLAHMRGVADGTLISLAIAQSNGPARASRLRRPMSTPCRVCEVRCGNHFWAKSSCFGA